MTGQSAVQAIGGRVAAVMSGDAVAESGCSPRWWVGRPRVKRRRANSDSVTPAGGGRGCQDSAADRAIR